MDHQNDTGPVLVQSVSKDAGVYGRVQANDRCSVYVLYWNKSTNTDAAGAVLLYLLYWYKSENADAAETLQAVSRQRRGGALAACFTTQFACLTGTKVQILTQQAAGGFAAHLVRARAY